VNIVDVVDEDASNDYLRDYNRNTSIVDVLKQIC